VATYIEQLGTTANMPPIEQHLSQIRQPDARAKTWSDELAPSYQISRRKAAGGRNIHSPWANRVQDETFGRPGSHRNWRDAPKLDWMEDD